MHDDLVCLGHVVLLILVLFLSSCGGGSGADSAQSSPPTVVDRDSDGDGIIDSLDEFPQVDAYGMVRVSPSTAGITAEKVNDFMDAVFDGDRATQGIMIVYKGMVIGERYAPGKTPQDRVTSWSVAKSLYASAIGIAIDEGWIQSLDDRVSDYITDWQGSDKEAMTIRHILSMRSGLTPMVDDNSGGGEGIFFSEDQTAFALARPLVYQPGSKYQYVNSTSQLMESVIKKATGLDAHDYLVQKLLKPIDIETDDIGLWVDATGINPLTYCCIDMQIEDFARFGLLTLKEGRWRTQQVLSSSFVRESGRPWPDDEESFYGFKWWLYNDAIFGLSSTANSEARELTGTSELSIRIAIGYQQQYLYVLPSHDLVIARFSLNNHNSNQGYIVNTSDNPNFPDTCTGRNACSSSEGEPVAAMNTGSFLQAMGPLLQCINNPDVC